jgi:hypothetical protein
MKQGLQLTILFFFLVCVWLGLLSSTDGVLGVYYSSGPASSNIDRTGGPLSGGQTCSSCHSGGSFGTTVTIIVKNSNGVSVSTYIPGSSYTVEYQVSKASGTPAGFGMQSVALGSNQAQAGNFTVVLTPNSKISTLNSRKYAEHSSISSSGFFSYTWVAPSSNIGNVTFYSVGMAVNGNGGTSGDQSSSAITKVLSPETPTTIQYSSSQYCSNAADPSPTIQGNQGGTFTASPNGLVINPSSGVVDLSASNTGILYTISYTHTGGTATAFMRVNPSYQISNSASICEGDSIFLANAWRKTAGTYVSQLTSSKNCDSVVTTQLSVNPSYMYNNQDTICEGDSLLIFGQYRKSSGTYSNLNQTTKGCDSNYFVHLTVNPSYLLTETRSFCKGDSTLVAGQYYYSDTSFTLSYQSAKGCDSLINYQISVNELDVSVNYQGNFTLSASLGGASYQWYDCSTSSPIQGAINQTFSPTSNGSYYVFLEKDNCSDSSICYNISGLGLGENGQDMSIIYPNPSTGIFKLKNIEDARVALIYSSSGLLLQQIVVEDLNGEISVNLPAGIYFLELRFDQEKIVSKLIIQK